MGRFGCLVLGPAGSGKSSFCLALEKYASEVKRSFVFVNLDPACDSIQYQAAVDVRELVDIDEIMTDMNLGPNGGLMYCMEYLADNLPWLFDQLNAAGPSDDEFFVFDCPGQIELYTHNPAMKNISHALQVNFGVRLCATFLVDSMMIAGDGSKYISAVLLATSSMLQVGLPWVNVLSKVDLLKASRMVSEDQDIEDLINIDMHVVRDRLTRAKAKHSALGKKLFKLNMSLCDLIEEYSMVQFVGLDAADPDSVKIVCDHMDFVVQYGEDLEPKEAPDAQEADDEGSLGDVDVDG